MHHETTKLQKRIESGKPLILAEISPPRTGDPEQVRALVRTFAGKVHGLGVSDNREGLRMSALATAALAMAENVEPLLHMTTRDRNRVALLSDCIGAHALGIRNVLCTSGTHQTLHPFYAAKNVYDIDATVLLQSLHDMEKNASIVGEEHGPGPLYFCLGAVASPYADPMELQIPRLAQKIYVGAQFVVTQPVFDLDRFCTWWKGVTERGLHTKAAFVAGIKILTDPDKAKAYASQRPLPMVPDSILQRIASQSNAGSSRAEGIRIALETIKKLSGLDGLRGFEIVCDDDIEATLEIIASLQ